MTPDVLTPRSPWDQDAALCIHGRAYKPMATAAALGTQHCTTGAPSGGGGGCESYASSPTASRPISAVQDKPPTSGTSASEAVHDNGWPFIVPQQLQPSKSHYTEVPTGRPPPPPGSRPMDPGIRISSPVVLSTVGTRLTAAVSAAAANGAVQYGGMLSESPVPLTLFESFANDLSAATTARLAPQGHSSRPQDCFPSRGGAAEVKPALNSGLRCRSDAGSPAADSALWGSGSQCSGQPCSGAQWPAMPLQPPTRRKPSVAEPTVITQLCSDGGGGGGAVNPLVRVQILSTAAPGSNPAMAPPPPITAANGSLPGPAPCRKLDYEMLADQVGRIMTHLSNINKIDGGREASAAQEPSPVRRLGATAAPLAMEGAGGGDGSGAVGGGDGAGPSTSISVHGRESRRLVSELRAHVQPRAKVLLSAHEAFSFCIKRLPGTM